MITGPWIYEFSLVASDRDWDLLAGDERARAQRYRRDADRMCFVAARAGLRRTLACHANVSAQGLCFAYGRYGKPWLPAHPWLRFNLTHAADRALVAVAYRREVGVDLEPIVAHRDLGDVARRFFSRSERAALAALDDDVRPAATLRCWCRKEAYLKARGDGLAHALDAFDMSTDLAAADASLLLASRPDAEEVHAWHVRDLPVGAGWVAALVVQRKEDAAEVGQLSRRDIPWRQ